MLSIDWILVIITLSCVILMLWPIGKYISIVFEREKTWLSYLFGWLENLLIKILGGKEQTSWVDYLKALLMFNLISSISLYLVLIFQDKLPLNPLNLGKVGFIDAFSITSSFITSTNLQTYNPEKSLSYFSQMAGLAVQNFSAASTGICTLMVLARSFKYYNTNMLGNFWQDLIKSTLYILLPLSIIFAVFLVSQGSVQNFNKPIEYNTLESATKNFIPQGPVASQIAIKHIGSNGGGFFNANAAHPFENPNYFTASVSIVFMLLLTTALMLTFGFFVNQLSTSIMWVVGCFTIFFISLALSFYNEFSLLNISGIDKSILMAGKETRFGLGSSVYWGAIASMTTDGSLTQSLEGLSPLGNGIYIANMLLGLLLFGGIGSGVYGLVILTVIAIFIGSLMIGRTPEFFNKKIEVFDVKVSMLALLIPTILIMLGIIVSLKFGLINAPRTPHDVTQILYIFSSAATNNGSNMGGMVVNDSTKIILGLIMLITRYEFIILTFMLAGNVANKPKIKNKSTGLPTDNAVFVFLLCAIVVFLTLITMMPLLSLGPLIEHILFLKGVIL